MRGVGGLIMEAIGRFVVASAICAATYFAARYMWDFPLDTPTWWFASLFSYAQFLIFKAICK
jgi:hypothetical protein